MRHGTFCHNIESPQCCHAPGSSVLGSPDKSRRDQRFGCPRSMKVFRDFFSEFQPLRYRHKKSCSGSFFMTQTKKKKNPEGGPSASCIPHSFLFLWDASVSVLSSWVLNNGNPQTTRRILVPVPTFTTPSVTRYCYATV